MSAEIPALHAWDWTARKAAWLLLALVAVVLTLTFATAAPARAQAPTCPCTLFTDQDAPFGDAVWDSPAELGIKFRSDSAGYITALRFYRQASNVGAREGHLWSATGDLLATVTFPAAPSGWQTAELGTPVAITANTTYIASYYASTGRFAFSLGAFNGAGIDRPPLHALAASEGGNGVYKYSPTSTFPTETWNGTNYWVDLVFHPSLPPDTRAPSIEERSPDVNETGVGADAKVTIKFDEPLDPLTVTNGAFTLADGANAVPASAAYDEPSRTVTLTPSAPLSLSKTYTARVASGNAGPADLVGNKLTADITWTFTTAPQCPCTLFDESQGPEGLAVQDQPLELGVRFRSNENGYITGLRFYKQPNNTGTHVGHLWTGTGQLLATATYTNETAEGWQQVDLPNPVPVTAGTVYVSSYHSPSGFYARTAGGFENAVTRSPLVGLANSQGGNGVYKYGASSFPNESWAATNYWVDVNFDRSIPPDTKGPSVVALVPAGNAVDVARTAVVEAEFDEPISETSITTSTFTLKDPQGGTVAGTTSYDAQTRTATFTPSAPLAFDTRYTATLKSGASGVKDVSGNPLAVDKVWAFDVAGKSPADGPGGPILLVSSPSDPFGTYYAEILRSEGLNAFSTETGTVTAEMLAGKTTVILASPAITAAEVTVLTNYVNAGGNLIAMRPDKKLAPLLGLTDAGTTLSDAYLKVDTSTAAGNGIEGQTLQFHGTADRYTLNGATALASLYQNAASATTNPAVTLRSVGVAGGQAAAFTFDLSRSVVYTRQGNPAWVDDKRDGTGGWIPTTRPIDLFYGPKDGDLQPNWVDMDKIDVPQADEQQRLLANLITQVNMDKAPLPRFWYLPRGEKAAVILTGDDHGSGAMVPYLERMKKMSPEGCSVADWECIRGTIYMYTGTQVTDAQVGGFQNDGFEIGLHLNTNCFSYTPASVASMLSAQLSAFAQTWPSLDPPVSNRTHCVAWSGWVEQPKAERAKGIRFDTNYYYQGPTGFLTKPGLLTGSGFPQRFGDLDGTIVDVYQSMTQVTDESDGYLPNPTQTHTLLDNALGSKGYYGVFNVLAHADHGDHNNANTMVSEAQRRGVPVVTSKQMLEWLDGRNGSSFADISYSGNTLGFSISVNPKANGLEAMLPASSAQGPIRKIVRDGSAVSWKKRTVKGQDYVVFKAAAGSYSATYATDTVAPEVTGLDVVTDVEGRATVKWTTDEEATSLVEYGRTTALGYSVENTARVNDHEVELSGLAPGSTYYVRVTSADAAGNTSTAPASPMSFTLPAGVVADTRTADFAAGTVGSQTYAGATLDGTDGEVTLKPMVGEEFDGSTLPSGWVSNPWYTGGFSVVGDGMLLADSAAVGTDAMYTAGRTLEFSATFQPVNDQSVGFSATMGDYPFATFTTGNNGDQIALYAHTGPVFNNQETSPPFTDVTLSRPHRFRIDWNASTVQYYVDGQLKATHNRTIAVPMRPMATDFKLFGAGVQVHWMRQGTFPSSGTFTSRAIDGGVGANVWQTLTGTAVAPSGTGVAYQTRTGATRTPDASWSAWQNVGANGAIVSPPGRFIQYQARLTRSTLMTPVLQRVALTRVAGTDQPPVQGTVAITPAAPKTNDVMTATPTGFSDPDNDPLTYHYQWFKNGTAIQGATTSTLSLAQAGNGDLGDKLRVEVYVTDGRGAATDPAIATKTVASTAPTAGTASVRPAPPSTNDVVTAVPTGFADIDGETLTYRYQWRKNNVPIAGATGRTLDLSVAGNGDLNDRIDVDITAVDGAGLLSPAARGGQNITGTNSTPVVGTASVTPASPKTDQLLTVTPTGFRDPDNDPITYAYQWKRNGVAVAGATGATYDLAPAGRGDRGDVITVDVTATDNKSATSDPATGTVTVENSVPVTGTAKVKPSAPASDDIVTAAPADFADADGDQLTYTYQWYRNGVAISGASGRQLDLSLPGNGDLGDTVGVEIRAMDGNGATSGAASGSAVVAATNTSAVAAYGFEEAAGTVAVDEAGGNDGVISGATRTNQGKFGRALYFDGVDDVVTVEDSPTLRLTTGMTMMAWVKPDAATDWRSVIFKEASGVGYSLYANGITDNASAHIGTPDQGEVIVDGGGQLDPNRWTHLAASFDGHILRLYADGVLIGSKAVDSEILHGVGPLTFGANNIWGEHFQGTIDEVKIYNRRLDTAAIAADSGAPVISGTPVPPASLEPTQVGQFEAPMQWPIVPVHLALLSNGKVAAWDGFEAAVNSEHTWDPWTKQFVGVPTGRNLFCAGHITLTDGRLLVAGGHINAYEGTKDTNLFTPSTNTWQRGADMAQARWYPTVTTLPDGRVFVVSGDNPVLDRPNQSVPLTIASNSLPEIYNPTNNTWTQVPTAQRWMPLYPFMFVLPDGRLFDAGPDTTTRALNLSTGQWSVVGTSTVDGQSAVQYRPGKILKSGTWSEPEFPGGTVTNKAEAIDFNVASPSWNEVAPMNYKRSYHTLTVLPDGKVLASGGQRGTDGVDEKTGVLATEIWDPDTNTWTTGASSRRPRLYHSSALLLPDGRVLLAGGGAFGNAKNEKSGELYSPPYLFKGPRPQVTAAPDRVKYNTAFTVDTPDASKIAKVNLVRMGSVTHNVDMDQRLVPLNFTKSGDSVQITGPSNANVAPPGYYMVFLVDDNGVPSHGQIVRVDSSADTASPSVPGAFQATAQTARVQLSWNASSDNVGVTEYRVYRSTTSGFTPSTANRIARVKDGSSYTDEGLAAGTYYYVVQAVDAAGNRSNSSPQRQAVVTGDTTAPTVSITAPAGAASLSGTVAVSATAADAVGVKSVQFMLDGQDLQAADTSAPYSVNWDTTTAPDGRHVLTAVARDATGNTRTSTAVNVEVHNTGAVAAYGFEEASGATVTDTVNSNTGTITGATRVADGRFGKALAFDGTDDLVTVGSSSALNLGGGMTLQAWVKPTTLGSWRSVILKENTGTLTYGLFASTDGQVPAGSVFSNAEYRAPASAGLALASWSHIAMTWDGATLKTFVDGAQVGSVAAPAPLMVSNGQLRIGGESIRNGWFHGLIDEVRIYSRALTPTEINADMNRAVQP